MLHFTNNPLNVALKSNIAIDLLCNSCFSEKKLSNSFSLLLSFRDFSANALYKISSSKDALWQLVFIERFALLRRYLYFDKGRP